jgi:hypothetical protein
MQLHYIKLLRAYSPQDSYVRVHCTECLSATERNITKYNCHVSVKIKECHKKFLAQMDRTVTIKKSYSMNMITSLNFKGTFPVILDRPEGCIIGQA